MPNKLDLIGQKFGRLTVVGDGPPVKIGNVVRSSWLCVCECGGNKIVRGDSLKDGMVRSCGCMAYESRRKKGKTLKDITGQKFGKLTAISIIEGTGGYGKNVKWLCKCDCGNTSEVSSSSLRSGNTKSCGCIQGSDEWKSRISDSHMKMWDKKGRHGTRLHHAGYLEYTCGPHKGKRVHDILIEQHIGRELLPNEVVHHKDFNRTNNDLSNLEVMTRSEHTKHHQELRRSKCYGSNAQ